MRNIRVANRYAKALWGLAEENDFTPRAYNDMQLVYHTFYENKEMKTIMKSPIIRIHKKLNILNGIFQEKIHPISMLYLTIIARKKRAALIEGIAFEYMNIHRQSLGIERVTLITCGEIEPKLQAKAQEIASSITSKKKIEFHQLFDPEIIGGFILKIGDLQYDASVKRKLLQMKKKLLES